MHIRALVAKADGTMDRSGTAFARGSITPVDNIPVTRNFDDRQPPIGVASIAVAENGDVYADMDILDVRELSGKTPAIGGRPHAMTGTSIDRFDVFAVSICDGPNADPRIPSIKVRD